MNNNHRFIESYVHKGKIGVLLELEMESDYTGQSMVSDLPGQIDEVRQVFIDIALQIAASHPKDIDDLLSQPFVKDPSKSVMILMSELATKMRERIEIIRFVRWDVEKNDFPEETPPRDPANVIRMVVRR